MIEEKFYEFACEFYTVEKVVQTVVLLNNGETETIRLEARFRHDTEKYDIASYKKEYFTVQPTFPQTNGKYDREQEDAETWVKYELPSVTENSADKAIERALNWLKDRCKDCH
ncbi:hypothetical protein KJ564_14425 [bacterium]|nr:hypothetical protein [bacterium]